MKAKKRFGQNFLVNPYWLTYIAETVSRYEGDVLVEIGGGTGNLTRELAGLAFSRFVVIEIDRDLIPVLRDAAPRAEVIQGNILDVPLDFGKRQVVAGNLPYYITKPILNHLIKYRDTIAGGVLMVQKEVGAALTAPVHSENYNAYSVYLRLFAQVEKLRTVKRGDFRPVPNVDSTLLKITMRPSSQVNVDEKEAEILFRAFRERRKTLVNNLKKEYNKEVVIAFLDSLGKSPEARAQELTVEEFNRLLKRLKKGEKK